MQGVLAFVQGGGRVISRCRGCCWRLSKEGSCDVGGCWRRGPRRDPDRVVNRLLRDAPKLLFFPPPGAAGGASARRAGSLDLRQFGPFPFIGFVE